MALYRYMSPWFDATLCKAWMSFWSKLWLTVKRWSILYACFWTDAISLFTRKPCVGSRTSRILWWWFIADKWVLIVLSCNPRECKWDTYSPTVFPSKCKINWFPNVTFTNFENLYLAFLHCLTVVGSKAEASTHMGLKLWGWRWAGTGTGDPFMPKIAKRWDETCKRNKASARILSFPGTCIAVNFMLTCIAVSTIYRINFINSTSLQFCLLITSTIAFLSQWKTMSRFDKNIERHTADTIVSWPNPNRGNG